MKKRWNDAGDLLLILLCVLIAMAVIAAFTGLWPWSAPNYYRSYSLQACAWLEGRLDLGQDYVWLELAIYEGKYYVSFPPFPSVVLLPFCAVMGEHTPDGWIALAVALTGAAFAWALCRELGAGKQTVFWTLFLLLGNGWLWLVMNGWVWFIAQNMCFTLCMIALYSAFRGRGGVSLASWAFAVGCRPMAIVYFPVLAAVLIRRWRQRTDAARGFWPSLGQLIRRRWYWAIAPLLTAAAYMALNYARFGNPLEFGHNYLPEFMREADGQFSLNYFMNNLLRMLLPPTFADGVLLDVSINGTAFWLVTPMLITFIAAWFCGFRRRRGGWALHALIPLMLIAYVAILCLHRTLGGWHFGNRYLVDTLPLAVTGILLWKPQRDGFDRANIPLFALGACLNLVGTVAVYNHWV